MNRTKIEWCATYLPDGTSRPGFTSNPIKFRDAAGKVVWGCVHASPGCTHCYAEALAHRYGRGGPFTAPTMAGLTPFVDDAELRAILRSKAPAGAKVFLGDMTDIFAPWVTGAMLDQVFATMALRPDLTFMLLTKRPERMREYLTGYGPYTRTKLGITKQVLSMVNTEIRRPTEFELLWPLPNVWLGTSVENQHWADIRIPELLATPAAVRFISAEPLLGPVGLSEVILPDRVIYPLAGEIGRYTHPDGDVEQHRDTGHISWVIAGGESGPGARPCDISWLRSIVQQCAAGSG